MNDSIDNCEQAGRYLETLINLEKQPELTAARMSLQPIRALLDRLGKPDQGLEVIHVAGSKGKGSTCLFAEGALTAAGKQVGLFTSPHLHSWTERFRVGGHDVEGSVLANAVTKLRPHVEWLRESDPANAPTFFDATTAAALLIFAEANLDYAILEVGLGGRLDSTNIVVPRVTCITSIELEHTDKLGDTVEEIAAEKAGIIKPRVPCVIGNLNPRAEQVIRDRAQELAAPIAKLGVDFPALDPSDLSVLGRHQADNAALALAAIDLLGNPDRNEFMALARKGIATTLLPGRIEVLSQDPWVVVDGAHTQASANALAEILAERTFDRATLLLSISGGKDLDAILQALLPQVDEVVVTRAEPNRSLPAKELAETIHKTHPSIKLRVIPDPQKAAKEALSTTGPGQLLVAAGSIYLAAIARANWKTL